MDNLILTLAVRWLTTCDAFSACLVCRDWNDALASDQDGGELWKQICQNTNPTFLRFAEFEQNPNLNHRRLASAFVVESPPIVATSVVASSDAHQGKQLEECDSTPSGRARKKTKMVGASMPVNQASGRPLKDLEKL